MVVVNMAMNHPKEGTKHFIQQRLTAVANIILGIVVFNFFINNIDRSYEDVINGLSNNLMWLIIIFFTFSMSFHMWIGLNHILYALLISFIFFSLLFTLFFTSG